MKFELEIENNYDLILRMMIKPKIAKLKMEKIGIFPGMNLSGDSYVRPIK